MRWRSTRTRCAPRSPRPGSRSASHDVPVGAVLLDADGTVLAHARNEREQLDDPTAHAEVLAIRRAAELRGDWRLTDTTLVVTLEPCVLCAGAILAARIPRLVFGAWDEKAGAVGSVYDVLRDRRLPHRVEVHDRRARRGERRRCWRSSSPRRESSSLERVAVGAGLLRSPADR